jgi:hypothetical protein
VDVRYTIGPIEIGDLAGPILKASNVHAPSALGMILDEQWDRHVAGAWANGIDWAWIVCDPVFDGLDEMGRYHGAKVAQPHSSPKDNPPIKSGSLAFYDGHVSLLRDPLPSEEEGGRPVEIWHIDMYFAYFEALAYALSGGTIADLVTP